MRYKEVLAKDVQVNDEYSEKGSFWNSPCNLTEANVRTILREPKNYTHLIFRRKVNKLKIG